MKITELNLSNFRNYENINLKFSDNINIFIGNNGEGKTNILESIYVLALTKSHRAYLDKNLILDGQVYTKIKANINKNNKNYKFELLLNQKGKKVLINNMAYKRISDYLSNLTVIMFSPDDLDLIKGSPSERRKFLNIEIAQLDNKYMYYLNDYNNLIKNRNEYLKNISLEKYNKEYLNILNNQIIEKAIHIYRYRFNFINNLENKLEALYQKEFKSNIKIKYITNLNINNFDEEKIKKELLNKLEKNLKKEIILGSTQYGPHKDDFDIYLNDYNIKEYGSQGQQRLSILCIKICELEIFKERTGYYPILLLDDVFSELDIKSRNKILNFINKDVQIFISSTDIKNISTKYLKKCKIFKIKNGYIFEKEKNNI